MNIIPVVPTVVSIINSDSIREYALVKPTPNNPYIHAELMLKGIYSDIEELAEKTGELGTRFSAYYFAASSSVFKRKGKIPNEGLLGIIENSSKPQLNETRHVKFRNLTKKEIETFKEVYVDNINYLKS